MSSHFEHDIKNSDCVDLKKLWQSYKAPVYGLIAKHEGALQYYVTRIKPFSETAQLWMLARDDQVVGFVTDEDVADMRDDFDFGEVEDTFTPVLKRLG